MSQPSITDWMQGIGSLVAIALSGASLVWQWRTASKSKGNRLTCEATRFGPEVWRMIVKFEADHRSSPPRLNLTIRNPRDDTSLISANEMPRRDDGMGNRPLNMASIFDIAARRSVTVEMSLERAPSLKANAEIFVRYPVESEPMKVELVVKTGGLFPAAKKVILLTPVG